jgi:uracil-DNA glycosylase
MSVEGKNALLLEIARCPNVRDCITNPALVHPCTEIVRSQGAKLVDEQQVPEPWLGNLATAPLLFISSNPSISPTEEHYPRWSWSDDKIRTFFNERFSKWIRSGIAYRKQDGTFSSSVRYWASIRARACELYDRDVTPGTDYALTEVVHCKAKTEKDAELAVDKCAELYLNRLLLCSGSCVVVIVGKIARKVFMKTYFPTTKYYGHGTKINVAGRDRFVMFVSHPNARERPSLPHPKTFKAKEFLPLLPHLRARLRGGASAVEPEMRIPGSVLSGIGDNRRRSPSTDHDTEPSPSNVIRLLTRENPKRGKSRLRFDCYRDGMTVAEYERAVRQRLGEIEARKCKGDLKWDTDPTRRFIRIESNGKPDEGSMK